MTRFLTVTAALALLAAPAFAEMAPMTAQSSAGEILTDMQGMSLYTFDKDTKGMSMCEGDCLAKWPAATAGAEDKPSGDYDIITRADGTRQWTYKGMPLYTWVKDATAGDVTGDGVGGVWHLARP